MRIRPQRFTRSRQPRGLGRGGTAMIDEGRLQDLIELGRTKGRLSTEDLQEVMPVSAMSVEDLATVILRLERAGIDIDIDPDLLQPQPGAARGRPVLVQNIPDAA